MDFAQPLLVIASTTFVTFLISALTWWLARRSGLGTVQIAVRQETDKLVMIQKERIQILEEQVEKLTKRVEYLEEERSKDRREISRLRKVIADAAIRRQDGDDSH